MKKIISVLLVLVMALSLLAACGNKDADSTEPQVVNPATAEEILTKTYAKYTETELFPVAGGYNETTNWEGPAKIDMTVDSEFLCSFVYVPADEIANLTDAATMQHGMMLNNFSAAALRVKEGVDAKTFAATMKDAILGTQWMCGFPEKLMVAVVGTDYVVVAFGLDNEEAPLITTFQTHLLEVYPDAEVLYTENIGA